MERYIKGFDGIRAIAVLSVIATHMNVWAFLENNETLNTSFLPLVSGYTGVQVFFVLSGFLITSLLISEHQSTGTISVKKFIIRRTLRIFPLYIFFLIIATSIHSIGQNVTTWDSLIYAYLYIYNFVPTDLYTSFLGHTWSLAVEEHFYIVFPSIFLLLFSKRRSILLLLLTLFLVGSLLLYYLLINSDYSNTHFVDRWSFIIGYNIAAGCLGALVLHTGKFQKPLKIMLGHPIGLGLGLAIFANTLYLHSGYWFIDHVFTTYLRAGGILILILWVYVNQTSKVVQFLEWQPLKYIGVISYGIYIYQGLFLATGPDRDPSQDWPLDQSIGLFLLIICAPLSYHFFERPFLKLKRKIGNPNVNNESIRTVQINALSEEKQYSSK